MADRRWDVLENETLFLRHSGKYIKRDTEVRGNKNNFVLLLAYSILGQSLKDSLTLTPNQVVKQTVTDRASSTQHCHLTVQINSQQQQVQLYIHAQLTE